MKGIRSAGKEVRIRRRDNPAILKPIPADWAWLDTLSGKFDDDFIAAVNEPVEQKKRPELDKMFR